MAVLELGWSTLVQAEAYFANERFPVTHWSKLADPDTKNRELNGAYNRIYYHPDYNVPAKGNATAAQLVKLIKAQSEMAYYLALHWGDEDRRKGLQAQAVIRSGIIKEVYDKDRLDKLPLPPLAAAFLEGFKINKRMAIIDIDRDENESVGTEVDDF